MLNRTINFLDMFSKNTILILSFIICSILFLLSLFGYWRISLPFDIVTEYGSFFYNIFAIIIVLLIFFLYSRLKIKKKTLIFIGLFVCAINCLLFLISNPLPYNDQGSLILFLDSFKNGTLDKISLSYISIWPHQLKLLALMSFIPNRYAFFFINIVFYIIAYFCFIGLIDNIYKNDNTTKWSIFIYIFFYPLAGFTCFYYGDSLFTSFIIIILYLIFSNKINQYIRIFIISILIVTGTILRNQMSIFVIALILCSIFIRNFDFKKKMILILMPFLITLIGLSNLIIGNRFKSVLGDNYNYQNKTPFNWIAMGISNDAINPELYNQEGGFNGFSINVFHENNGDITKINKAAKDVINNRIKHFSKNPSEALNFYGLKTAKQWSIPDFGMYSVTMRVTNEGIMYNPIISDVGNLLMKGFNIIVFALLAFNALTKVKSNKFNNLELIIYTFFIGGFLFSIIWEAKARYNLPYFVVSLLIIPNIIDRMQNSINRKVNINDN